ncbi:hypothetical protein HanRHA438_Chr15g0701171 [Helianthus annuus]|nr:hypothetical protein HanIR_Chr15g0748561 [Helianthus annuus]KAJ0844324.1 hypothetical protein HanRHA438_Chr15g0701171 [Helianthus annuus]
MMMNHFFSGLSFDSFGLGRWGRIKTRLGCESILGFWLLMWAELNFKRDSNISHFL